MSNPFASLGKNQRVPLPTAPRMLPVRVPSESEADMFAQATGIRPADPVRGRRLERLFCSPTQPP